MRLMVARVKPRRAAIAPCLIPSRASANTPCLIPIGVGRGIVRTIRKTFEKICRYWFKVVTVWRLIWGNDHLSCGFGARRSHFTLHWMSAQGSVGFRWGTITGPYHANFSQVETQKFDPHWFYCLQWGCNNLLCQECIYLYRIYQTMIYTWVTVNYMQNALTQGSGEMQWIERNPLQVVWLHICVNFTQFFKNITQTWYIGCKKFRNMMTSSSGNTFRVTGPLCGELQRPVTQSFDVFFDLRLHKRLSKQSWGWWFETPSCSLWRHRNDELCFRFYVYSITYTAQLIHTVCALLCFVVVWLELPLPISFRVTSHGTVLNILHQSTKSDNVTQSGTETNKYW